MCNCSSFIRFSPLQWDLICDKSSLPNLSQSGYFLGFLIGAWVFGTVTDMIGRKKVFFMSTLCAAVCNVLSGLAPGFYFFAFFRVAIGFFSAGLFLSNYAIFMEITGISQRTFVGMAVHAFFGVGCLVLAVMAYLIRDWRALSVIAGLAGFLFLLLWRCVFHIHPCIHAYTFCHASVPYSVLAVHSRFDYNCDDWPRSLFSKPKSANFLH